MSVYEPRIDTDGALAASTRFAQDAAGVALPELAGVILAHLMEATEADRGVVYLPDTAAPCFLAPVLAVAESSPVLPLPAAAVGRRIECSDGSATISLRVRARLLGAVHLRRDSGCLLDPGGARVANLAAQAAGLLGRVGRRPDREAPLAAEVDAFRSPLTCVVGFSELLRATPGGLSPIQETYVRALDQSAQTLLDAFTRVERAAGVPRD